jgi:hypothetical protein
MPRYFFHLINGDRSTRDLDGVDLSDLSAADREAREMARDLTGSVVTRPGFIFIITTGWRLLIIIDPDDGRETRDQRVRSGRYAELAGKYLGDILAAALRLLEKCPEHCDRSCESCLRHYHNQHLRDRLDRHVGAQLLRYATHGELPSEELVERQAAALGPLKRLLELDGYRCESVAATKDGPVPLMVQREGQRLAVGVKSSLLDTTWNGHSLQRMGARGGPSPAILNDYILRRNLPDEHQLIRDRFEHAN